jgi:Uma2 family endonuclease
MSAAARERFLVEVLDALTEPAEAMTEGRPHKHAKAHALDLLGLHFRTLGRSVYVQEEMAIVYPGEPVFSPDIIAVLDVVQPAVDERLAWVVADEGKGIDFVLEVLHQGDRQKDLVHNVQRYARLSIPEYFVYDRALQRIVGHRLGAGSRYERIVPQGGRTPSAVLGLDLAIEKGSLRFFHGAAELYDSTSLIERLSGLVGDLQARADEETARAEEAATRATDAEARASQAVEALRAGIVQLLRARDVAIPEAALQRLNRCDDSLVLGRWLGRALITDDAESALGDD